MKKLIMLLLLIFLCSSCTLNQNYQENKKILNQYTQNGNYAFLTTTTYESGNHKIDFQKLIKNKIIKDGKKIQYLYSTRYQQILAGDSLYFCYEYNWQDDMGCYALGYIDFPSKDVHLDYFEGERYIFKYEFSTNQIFCYKLEQSGSNPKEVYVIFSKGSDTLYFDYDIKKLDIEDQFKEVKHSKDFYVEDGKIYQLNTYEHTLTNQQDGSIINLPYQNDLLRKIDLMQEMYEQFSYDNVSIYATYISTGDELFFFIEDRPTNNLNAPFIVFKCNIDFTDVEYIGYSEKEIIDIIHNEKTQ